MAVISYFLTKRKAHEINVNLVRLPFCCHMMDFSSCSDFKNALIRWLIVVSPITNSHDARCTCFECVPKLINKFASAERAMGFTVGASFTYIYEFNTVQFL